MIRVKSINPYGMVVITDHDGQSSANLEIASRKYNAHIAITSYEVTEQQDFTEAYTKTGPTHWPKYKQPHAGVLGAGSL